MVVGGSWGGHRIDAEIFPKQLQRRHKQRCLKIDSLIRGVKFFGRSFYRFSSSENRKKKCVGIIFGTPAVPRTSTTVLGYRRMFTQFFLRVWVSEYTSSPIIANLLCTSEIDDYHKMYNSFLPIERQSRQRQ